MNRRSRVGLVPALTMSFVALGWVCVPDACSAAGDETQNLEKIRDRYQAINSRLKNIKVSYTLKAKNLIPMEELAGANIAQYLSNQSVTYAVSPKNTYCREISHANHEGLIKDRVQIWSDGKIYERRLNHEPGEAGSESELPNFIVQYPDKSEWARFPCLFLSACCIDYPDPSRDESDRRRSVDQTPWDQVSIPWVIGHKNVVVRPARADIDGASCVVVDVPGWQSFWFDPSKGYSLCRRELYEGRQLASTLELKDLTLLDGVWVPKRIVMTTIALSGVSARYLKKPALVTTLDRTRLEFNSDLKEIFDTKITPGALVVDTTIKPTDPKGIEITEVKGQPNGVTGISFRQPVKESDLEQVISDAKRETGDHLLGRVSRWTIALLTLVCALMVVTGVILARRSPGAGSTDD